MSSAARHAAAGRWLVFAATVFWASTATLARFVFRDRHVPPLTVVELRLTVASVVLLAWLLARKRGALRIRPGDLGYLTLLGLLGVAATQGTYYYSISKLGVGLAILIQYLAPSLIVAHEILRGRPVAWTMIAAVASATAGTALLVGGGNPATVHAAPLHWAICFASAFVFAFYIVYSKRGLERYAPETMLFYTFSIAALFWAIVTPPWKIVAAHYPPDIWALFVVLGLFSTLVPFGLFNLGLRRLPASEASVIATSEPLVAMFTAGFFLHEQLRPLQFVGAALVLGAALLASRGSDAPLEAAALEAAMAENAREGHSSGSSRRDENP